MKPAALALMLAILASPACGSTTESWNQLASASQKSCLAAILKQHGGKSFDSSRISGRVLGIGGASEDAYYGLTIEWRTKRVNESWLCLYDKKAKKAQARMIEAVAANEGK